MADHIRYLYPAMSQCPACGDKRHAGKPSRSRSKRMEYRRCKGCGFRYRVVPIAEERDDGGAWSKIVPL